MMTRTISMIKTVSDLHLKRFKIVLQRKPQKICRKMNVLLTPHTARHSEILLYARSYHLSP